MFTFPRHNWNVGFIFGSLIAVILGRALNVYPLTFLLNLGRKNKIPINLQHMLFFTGLRGLNFNIYLNLFESFYHFF